MTAEEATLSRLAQLLESLGIPYMVSGSVASSFHGKPRTTHDADVVVDPTPEALERLISDLSAAGFYVDRDRAKSALAARRQFNVIEMSSAFKLDLIIRKDRSFSREEFNRRQIVDLGEATRLQISTPEDTILSKLEWAKKGGGSERQLWDVRGIIDVKGAHLDRAYIERWAQELDVVDLWREVKRDA